MNIIDISNNYTTNLEEDGYGFFYEFDQNTSTTDEIKNKNQQSYYRINTNILKNWNAKYKYTVIKPTMTPMLIKTPTLYNFNIFKNKSPKSSKVMPILDNEFQTQPNYLQYNIKENNTIRGRFIIHTVFIISVIVSMLLIFLNCKV
jgi:hypothetical protein